MGIKVMPYRIKPDKVRPKIIEALSSAIHEWVLIFLLFIVASFSYLVTKFARRRHLETPCLLCSRLDHVFGWEKSNYYLDLICHKHKLQISSLVLCHYHKNLVDVHELCENCLFSFAAVNKSNAETYRLLVGKMGVRPQIGLDENSSCSCCHAKSVSRAYAPQKSQTKSPEFEGSELKFPLPWFVNSEVNEHKISRDETYRAGKVSPSSMSNFNPIPHLEHEKVKLSLDSESEAPLSEDEAASFLLKEHCKRCLAELGVGTSSDDPESEKFVHPARESEPSHMESEVKRQVSNTKLIGEVVTGGRNTFFEHENDTSATPDLISFADDILSPRDTGDVLGLHKATLEVREEAEVATEELKARAENHEVANPAISLSTSVEQSHSEGDLREEAEVETEDLKKSVENCEVANPSISLSTSEEQSHAEGKVREEADVETEELKESAENREVANPSISLSTSWERSHSEGDVIEEAEVETEELKERVENCEVANPSISLSTSEEQSHSEGDVREEAKVEAKELKESAENCEAANPSISSSISEEQSHSEGDVREEAKVEAKELKESAENCEAANPPISPSISEEQSHSEGDVREEAKVETKELKESAENCEVANPSILPSISEEQPHSEGDVREEAKVETKELKESAENCEVANPSISPSISEEQSHSEGDVREEAKVETKDLKESAEHCEVANPSILPSTSEEQSHSEGDTGGRGSQMPDSLELGDAYKLAVNSRRRQLSSKLLEHRSLSGKLLQQRSLSFKESPRGNEDFQHMLSQLSLARGIEMPLTDMSPNFRGNFCELTGPDASSSAGAQGHQRRVSLEINESNISLDGIMVNEMEGESEIDRLKRQVDHDKKLMYALYKELEEERNASAIAANQAMAMITRLQEEKAAVNMEALQCIRMMDEQVEYDEEGLEFARNLLTEKDEVVQELEFKLHLYTQKYGPLSIEEDMVESFTSSPLEDSGADDMNSCHVESSMISNPESNQEDTFDSQAGGSRDGNQLS